MGAEYLGTGLLSAAFWVILGSTPGSASELPFRDHDGEFQQPPCERLSGRDAGRLHPGTGMLPSRMAPSSSMDLELPRNDRLSCLTPKRRRDRHPATRRGCVRRGLLGSD
jgi:hypothetical protein